MGLTKATLIVTTFFPVITHRPTIPISISDLKPSPIITYLSICTKVLTSAYRYTTELFTRPFAGFHLYRLAIPNHRNMYHAR